MRNNEYLQFIVVVIAIIYVATLIRVIYLYAKSLCEHIDWFWRDKKDYEKWCGQGGFWRGYTRDAKLIREMESNMPDFLIIMTVVIAILILAYWIQGILFE